MKVSYAERRPVLIIIGLAAGALSSLGGVLLGWFVEPTIHWLLFIAALIAAPILFKSRHQRAGMFAYTAGVAVISGLSVFALQPKYSERADAQQQADLARQELERAESETKSQRDELRTAEQAICESRTDADRDTFFDRFAKAVENASTTKDLKADVEKYKKSLTEIREVERTIQEIKVQLEPPLRPEKPTYEEPKYGGTFQIVGRCLGSFDTGIVVESSGLAVAVTGADPCDVGDRLRGYVTPTSRTVEYEGITIFIVSFASRQTYADERAAYREEVADAKREYRTAMAEYPGALKKWQTETKAYERERRVREQDYANAIARRRAKIVALVQCN